MGHPGRGVRPSRPTDERVESRPFDRQAGFTRTRGCHHQPGRRRPIAHARRIECRRAFCDRRHRAAVVGLSFCERGAHQTRHYPDIDTAAGLGGSAIARCRGGLPHPAQRACEAVNDMTKARKATVTLADRSELPSHRVRLPGFITDEEIGLGEVVKRATSYLGIKSCGGCARRAAALDRWMVFTRRHQRSESDFQGLTKRIMHEED